MTFRVITPGLVMWAIPRAFPGCAGKDTGVTRSGPEFSEIVGLARPGTGLQRRNKSGFHQVPDFRPQYGLGSRTHF
jgi:hypothetical protein